MLFLGGLVLSCAHFVILHLIQRVEILAVGHGTTDQNSSLRANLQIYDFVGLCGVGIFL